MDYKEPKQLNVIAIALIGCIIDEYRVIGSQIYSSTSLHGRLATVCVEYH